MANDEDGAIPALQGALQPRYRLHVEGAGLVEHQQVGLLRSSWPAGPGLLAAAAGGERYMLLVVLEAEHLLDAQATRSRHRGQRPSWTAP